MRVVVAMFVICLCAAPVFAQAYAEETANTSTSDDTPGMVVWTAVTWPTELNDQPLVMSKNMVQIHLDAFANLSSGSELEPFALAPDIQYGITDRFTVALLHNLGLCLTGTDGGCRTVYDDVALQARFLITRTYQLELVAFGGLEALTIDPFALGLRLGAAFKFKKGRIAIFAEPNFKVGLTQRDLDPMSMIANKETLAIPLRVSFQFTNKLAFYGRTGLTGASIRVDPNPGIELDNFGDSWGIPLGLGAFFGVVPRFDIGLEFNLPTLVWPGRPTAAPGAFDLRSLIVFADYRI